MLFNSSFAFIERVIELTLYDCLFIIKDNVFFPGKLANIFKTILQWAPQTLIVKRISIAVKHPCLQNWLVWIQTFSQTWSSTLQMQSRRLGAKEKQRSPSKPSTFWKLMVGTWKRASSSPVMHWTVWWPVKVGFFFMYNHYFELLRIPFNLFTFWFSNISLALLNFSLAWHLKVTFHYLV